MTDKTVRIGDTEVILGSLGDKITFRARDLKAGTIGPTIQMTKEQCSTLGDMLKIVGAS